MSPDSGSKRILEIGWYLGKLWNVGLQKMVSFFAHPVYNWGVCVWCSERRLKELEQQFAMEKAASERQFEKQRQVRSKSVPQKRT